MNTHLNADVDASIRGYSRRTEPAFSWQYENGEARCEADAFALFASRNRCFVMQGGIEVASERTETLMEGVLFCENWVLKWRARG